MGNSLHHKGRSAALQHVLGHIGTLRCRWSDVLMSVSGMQLKHVARQHFFDQRSHSLFLRI